MATFYRPNVFMQLNGDGSYTGALKAMLEAAFPGVVGYTPIFADKAQAEDLSRRLSKRGVQVEEIEEFDA